MPNQLEVEAVIRDAATPVLQQIGKEIENLVRKANEGNKTFGGLDTSLNHIARTMTGGAASVAAGFVATAKVLDDFAVSQLHVRNMAVDMHTSVENVRRAMDQFARRGLDVGQGLGQMGSILDKIEGMGAYLNSDEFFRGIQRTAPEVANQMAALARLGKGWEAKELAVRTYMNSSKEAQKYWRDQTGTTHSWWLAQNDDLQNHIGRWKTLEQSEQRYHDQLTDLKNASSNVWESIAHHTSRILAAL